MNGLCVFLVTISFILYSEVFSIRVRSMFNRSMLMEKYPGYGTDWIFVIDGKNKLQKGYLKLPPNEPKIFPTYYNMDEVVIFNLFTRENEDSGEIIKLESESLAISLFDYTKKTKFIIHGWLGSSETDMNVMFRNSYLSKYDCNVFSVDWSEISKNYFYPIPMVQTEAVGKQVGKFLDMLIDHGTDPNDIHLIGHSLGAHVSGFAAKSTTKAKIGRVTGLDPAFPGFATGFIMDDRLSKNYSNFVDVIHTHVGFIGMEEPIGHADFYPNGGSIQPGCEGILERVEGCSHMRSWRYFNESILSNSFVAVSCESYEKFLIGDCKSNDQVVMGEETPTTSRGTFYLQTSSVPPFAISDLIDNGL